MSNINQNNNNFSNKNNNFSNKNNNFSNKNNNFSKKKPYFVINNNIIKYSCKVNPYILPVYMYSWIHAQYNNDNLVDINIALISATLAPSKKDNGINTAIKNVLKMFGGDVEDFVDADGSVIKGFPQAIDYRFKIDDVKATSRLKYSFVDSMVKYENNFTMIPFEVYNKIIEWCDDYNYNNCSTDTKKKYINAYDIINVYSYMKMKIDMYEHYGKNMVEGINTITENFGLGNKTVTKYLNLLCADEKIGEVVDRDGGVREVQIGGLGLLKVKKGRKGEGSVWGER